MRNLAGIDEKQLLLDLRSSPHYEERSTEYYYIFYNKIYGSVWWKKTNPDFLDFGAYI